MTRKASSVIDINKYYLSTILGSWVGIFDVASDQHLREIFS